MMEAGAMSAASIQATLEAHAAVARRLNREYELTAPAPTGVNAQGLERRDLRRLVVLASEPLLRRIFKNLTRADLQELQSTLDDEEGKFREYELLASQNFLRDLYDRAPTVAPTVGCPAKGSSLTGVKIRSPQSASRPFGSVMKTVSDRLNSAAMACIA